MILLTHEITWTIKRWITMIGKKYDIKYTKNILVVIQFVYYYYKKGFKMLKCPRAIYIINPRQLSNESIIN